MKWGPGPYIPGRGIRPYTMMARLLLSSSMNSCPMRDLCYIMEGSNSTTNQPTHLTWSNKVAEDMPWLYMYDVA